MKNVPKYVIVFAVIYVLILGGGGYGLYWSMDLKNQNIQDKQNSFNQLQSTLRSEIFPDPANKKALEEVLVNVRQIKQNTEAKFIASSKIFDPLRSREAKESDPKGKVPNEFKKILVDKREELENLALEQEITLPNKPYWFTMDAYREVLPNSDITGKLSIHLLTIEHLFKMFAESGIKNLTNLRRALSEFDNPRGQRARYALPAEVLTGEGGNYLVYPYEITFRTTLEPFRKFVNKINQADLPFIIRFIDIKNTNTSIETKSYYQNQSFTLSNGKEKTFAPVLGQEEINVTMWIDMIEWIHIAPKSKEN